jgi:hypothetical protein
LIETYSTNDVSERLLNIGRTTFFEGLQVFRLKVARNAGCRIKIKDLKINSKDYGLGIDPRINE